MSSNPSNLVVNPSLKLEWMEQNWSSAEARQAKRWVLEHVRYFLLFVHTLPNNIICH